MLLRLSICRFVARQSGELFHVGYPLVADDCSTFADNVACPAALPQYAENRFW
jgi:hypothetical protein